MKSLFLDIASHEGIIACCDEAAVISSKTCSSRVGDHELIPFIEEVLASAKWSYNDLTHVACVIGPGGFTSLRIVTACVNMLADQLDIPSAGVHLSELYACRVQNGKWKMDPSTGSGGKWVWVHSTKRNELFVRSFRFDQWPEATHIQLDDFLEQIPEGIHWTGELIDEHLEAIKEKNLQVLKLVPTADVLPAFLGSLEYNKEILLPWYGREG